METFRDNHSVLDDLGAEVTGIAWPVSLCMAITIFLVRLLQASNDDEEAVRSVVIAEVIRESEDETAGNKLRGSLINAIVFVAIVTAMTFIIVLLFKYGCVKLIYGYMGFATFMIFFIMTGGIVLDLLQTLKLRMDLISLVFILYNFAIVGSTILFFTPAPLLLKQVYLMWTGVVVAYIFTSIPQWTTWVLLVAMALYDLFAVLTPSGPLQMLVNLAMERDEDIPALVYEAREVRRPRRRNAAAEPQGVAESMVVSRGGNSVEFLSESDVSFQGDRLLEGLEDHWGSGSSTGRGRGTYRGARALGESQEPRMDQNFGQIVDSELARLHRPPDETPTEEDMFHGDGVPVMENGPQDGLDDTMVAPEDATESLLAATEPTSHASTPGGPPPGPPAPEVMTPSAGGEGDHSEVEEEEGTQGRRLRRRQVQRDEDEVDDPYELGIPSAVKLGLGDFIFYSVLVGRASLYDWLTVYSSFIGVIAGLGITLWLLAVAKKALPALPVSIALGIVFYFLTRATLEAFVAPPFIALVSW